MTDKRARLPYLPLFVTDYLSSMSVRTMTYAERGLYIHLMALQWQERRLPNNPRMLSILTDGPLEEFVACWKVVQSKFIEDDDGLYNERLDSIRDEYEARHRKLSKAGRKRASQAAKVAASQAASQGGSTRARPIPSHPIPSHSTPPHSTPKESKPPLPSSVNGADVDDETLAAQRTLELKREQLGVGTSDFVHIAEAAEGAFSRVQPRKDDA